MQGYVWARTPAKELFVVLVVDGKGYVPGVENAIDLFQIELLEPVQWPTEITRQNRNSGVPLPGALVPDATPECSILAFAASA